VYVFTKNGAAFKFVARSPILPTFQAFQIRGAIFSRFQIRGASSFNTAKFFNYLLKPL